jgi:quinol monooxygenase YgiN
LSQAWDQQCDIQQMEGEVWRSRTHGRQTKSADQILVSVLDYPAVGNVSKGGKNGIPIRGRAPYRSAIVVQRLRYPLNETEDVTCDQSASRLEVSTKPLFNVCKSRLDPINTRRKDVVVGFVIITAKPECCDDVLRVYRAVISRVLEEKGSIQYSGDRSLLWASAVYIGGRVIGTIGMWESQKDFKAHAVLAHLEACRSRVEEIVVSRTLQLVSSRKISKSRS